MFNITLFTIFDNIILFISLFQQLIAGMVLGTIVFFADLYFLIKKTM